jgi:hypothetical protein
LSLAETDRNTCPGRLKWLVCPHYSGIQSRSYSSWILGKPLFSAFIPDPQVAFYFSEFPCFWDCPQTSSIRHSYTYEKSDEAESCRTICIGGSSDWLKFWDLFCVPCKWMCSNIVSFWWHHSSEHSPVHMCACFEMVAGQVYVTNGNLLLPTASSLVLIQVVVHGPVFVYKSCCPRCSVG